MGPAEIVAIVAIVVGAATGLGGVGLGWFLQERSTDKRALKQAQAEHARVATQCFLQLVAIEATDAAFYASTFHRMADQAREQRGQLAFLAESFLLSLAGLPDAEFAASRRLWHRMMGLTSTDPMVAHSQGASTNFAAPVIAGFIERFPHLADLVAEHRQLQEADQRHALEAGEQELREALLEAVPSRATLGRLLQSRFAISPTHGLNAVRLLVESATELHEADIPVAIGVIGDVTRNAWLTPAQIEELAAALCALLGPLPPDTRVPVLLEMMPVVSSGLSVPALILSADEHGLPTGAYAPLQAALSARIAELSKNEWTLLNERQLPRILAVWAAVDPSAAAAWVAARLGADNWGEGVRFLHAYVILSNDGHERRLDAGRLSLFVGQAQVEAFLRRNAHNQEGLLTEVTIAFRATPAEAWQVSTDPPPRDGAG